jgi:pimeloyl-ACP methyl ester carboxylesterase
VETIPSVRYTRSGGVNIAHMRWGQGPHVVVYTPPFVSNVELAWERPQVARAAWRGGEHHQFVMLDKRGMELSDHVPEPPSLGDHVMDALSVIDPEGLERVELVGHSEGGAIAIALAVEYPDRVQSMVLIDAVTFGVPRHELSALADAAFSPG